MVADFHRGIHALLTSEYFASGFALVRPVIESLARAHVAIKGSDEDVEALLNDRYRVNLEAIGPWIDAQFGLGNLMSGFLSERTRKALHGFTHVGLHQLGRRFDGDNVKAQYSDGEIVEVIRVTTSASFMLSNLVTKHFGFEDDWKKVGDMFEKWGQH